MFASRYPEIHLQITDDEQRELEEKARAAYLAAKAAQDNLLQAEKNYSSTKKAASRKKSKATRLGHELKAKGDADINLIVRHQAAEEAATLAQRDKDLAKKELAKTSALAKRFKDEFNSQPPLARIYNWAFREKLAALLITTLVFSFYQFKTSIKTTNQIAEVWDLDPPPSDITTPIGIFVTSVDTLFNALLVNLTLEVFKDVTRHYEKYALDPFSLKKELFDLIQEAKAHPSEVPINVFHWLVKRIHNYASAASYILGIDEWINPALGQAKWAFYLALFYLTDIYFRNSQDTKYDKGAKIFWPQMKLLAHKAIFEGEIIRASDLVIRGIMAGGILRGLNFYSIWDNFGKISSVAAQLSAKIVGGLSLCHALCVRFTKSFQESGLAHQEKLQELFAEQLLKTSLQKLEAENELELDSQQLRLHALTIAAGTETYFEHPEDARLRDDYIEKISNALLLEKAGILSRAYATEQRKILHASVSYCKGFTNFLGDLPIASARAGLAYLVCDHYLSACLATAFNFGGLSPEKSLIASRYVASPFIGLLAGGIYHLSSKQNRIDRRILEAFDTPRTQAAEMQEADYTDPVTNKTYAQRFKNCCTIDGTAKYLGYSVSLLAGVSRVGGQVYASAEPMINAGINNRIALMSALELALEQVANSMDVFTVDVQKTLKNYFEYFRGRKATIVLDVSPPISPASSPARTPQALFNNNNQTLRQSLIAKVDPNDAYKMAATMV